MKEKITKLLSSPIEEDIILALHLLRDKTFEELKGILDWTEHYDGIKVLSGIGANRFDSKYITSSFILHRNYSNGNIFFYPIGSYSYTSSKYTEL